MMTATHSQPQQSFFKRIMQLLSKVGSTLMFPIAILPVAAILLRIGAEIPTATAFARVVQTITIKGGGIVFDNLHLIFAVGLAFGFTKDKRGEAAFAGLIGVLITTFLVPFLVKEIYGSINLGEEIVVLNDKKEVVSRTLGFEAIFGGKFNAVLGQNILTSIFVGALVAWIYNKTNTVELPKVLGFFSGKRLIPALTIIAATVFSIGWAIIFPWVAYVIYAISKALSDATAVGETATIGTRFTRASIMGVYGFINRLLIPFGLHHIPNNLFWFQLGSWAKEGGQAGETVNGDIFIFLSGVAKNNPGGIFQAGFFPMMMFGLPALVVAFAYTAESKEQKTKVIALFGSAALVSFLSGITEPIEFAFLYASPLLYFVHAVLTGIFAFITGAFGIQLGFGFSAGLIDFITSIPKSMAIINESGFTGASRVFANPAWIIPIGILTAATYFFVGKILITKLNLSTPGRGAGVILQEEGQEESQTTSSSQLSAKGKQIVKGFGGWDNIVEYNNCSTRLRYVVKDGSKVNEEEIKKAGAFGLAKMSDTSFQAIIGVEAESLNNEIVSHIGEEL
ncbi:PTS system, N-acetylglucosamine-specific, IICBA component [Mycoplasmopsis canis PG 14]|uniref:PTS transporter subunit EIIC n=1 Tax=Mycoplasmopsis canis TaxID=29555 RepID=UPI00025AEC16|nr:PTS transporter subunit EIIC [Mycoplasmopsis canis]AMD81218.1 PTS glucose transporter subunit IIABC [Mycoplasmopsis canis PG 14]EIE39718.1 PTS system, N-acetylglucosamine-specific, IICBA component [Mycoplasmopsis canis PG 14]